MPKHFAPGFQDFWRIVNTVIVVSHDRYFLDMVCTHMVDIDFSESKFIQVTILSGTRPAS
ncbi:MAG: hypothetical protein R2788_08195 [Saprospiraceae bacterium]